MHIELLLAVLVTVAVSVFCKNIISLKSMT